VTAEQAAALVVEARAFLDAARELMAGLPEEP
jgi:hypothetical protein